MAGYGSGTYGAGRYGRALSVLAVTEQDVWPPRLLIAVTGLTIGDDVVVYRTVLGSAEQTMVRGGNHVIVTDTSLILVDAEQPMGVPITYHLQANGIEVTTANVQTDIEQVALTDAINGNACQVAVWTWPSKTRTRNGSVFQVGGRNIVVSGSRGQFASTLEVYTETESAREALLDLLDNATGGVLQIRQSGGYNGVDGYLAVQADTETRGSQQGKHDRRIWSLDVVEVGPWADGLQAHAFTWQDVADAYEGLTWADLAADYTSWLDLAQGDFS